MFSHLRYAHATLWIDDRAYRWSWYIWPQLAALLIAGFMFFTFNSPADNHATWAKPSNAEDVARSLQLLRDQAYENRSAFERLEKLSAGKAVASFYLATFYDPNMPRRSSSIAADAKRTLKLYEPAAEQGNQFAQFN